MKRRMARGKEVERERRQREVSLARAAGKR